VRKRAAYSDSSSQVREDGFLNNEPWRRALVTNEAGKTPRARDAALVEIIKALPLKVKIKMMRSPRAVAILRKEAALPD